MDAIINDERSFAKTLNFIKKYFDKVKVINNKYSHLASQSQCYFKTILFENRGAKFSIKWNFHKSTLYFGDITKTEKTSFQYSFTKIKLDSYYPIEEMNNYNVMFWEIEISHAHDNIGFAVSPVRLPITIKDRSASDISDSLPQYECATCKKRYDSPRSAELCCVNSKDTFSFKFAYKDKFGVMQSKIVEVSEKNSDLAITKFEKENPDEVWRGFAFVE